MTDAADDCPVPELVDNVVPLTDFLSRKRKPLKCEHTRLEVDETNRTVGCKDCKRQREPFEALLIISRKTSDFQNHVERMRADYRLLAGWVPHRRIVRELESMWRGNRLPLCPHCKKGVTAERLAAMGWVSKAYAEAVERHEAETQTAASVSPLREE